MHRSVLVADSGDIYELLYPWSKYEDDAPKPQAKFDYFGVGGRFEGYFHLKQPRQLRKFFGLFSAGSTTRVSVAKKYEIDQDSLLRDPPAALFFRGELYECPLFAEGDKLSKWKMEFAQQFAQVPDDSTLQIVDAHS